MKEIKDYLHLYLGCEVVAYKSQTASLLIGFDCKRGWAKIDSGNNEYEASAENIQLILRPLSDMTEDEAKQLVELTEWPPHYRDVNVKRNKFNDLIVTWDGMMEGGEEFNATGELFYSSEQFQWLLQKHFDVFQLIESGLAIDKTKT